MSTIVDLTQKCSMTRAEIMLSIAEDEKLQCTNQIRLNVEEGAISQAGATWRAAKAALASTRKRIILFKQQHLGRARIFGSAPVRLRAWFGSWLTLCCTIVERLSLWLRYTPLSLRSHAGFQDECLLGATPGFQIDQRLRECLLCDSLSADR